MATQYEHPPRVSSHGNLNSLEDRFELLKEIGDGSFGSVALARVRTAGANIARRGTMVAIKTMKKTYESFTPCLELREVIFLRSLPTHAHLVPALDIFLDPLTKKLHICMEYMDGNLYQLMKSRDQRPLDCVSVKSILFQILGGLEHIHAHDFFHRDIKPENILVTASASPEINQTLRRYSSLVTPPSTPTTYAVKIADFGLARETYSNHPYTTYVSTRWYRAPEVLLRAGEYSAPVDIWALGAMAVEVANLKPLFPGGNEVDQVWRVCEIMGSPGNWYDKAGNRVGGGEWRDGTRLAQKLGFSFPKMAPHNMETIVRPPQWPASLCHFVTWCMMWDPRSRPTSSEALRHDFFSDAIDPLRPRSSRSGLLGKKHMSVDGKAFPRDSSETPTLSTSRSSWFRKSIVRDQSPVVSQQHQNTDEVASARQSMIHIKPSGGDAAQEPASTSRFRPFVSKRATWTHGAPANNAAPMPILPSIRPISPFSNTVTALAHNSVPHQAAYVAPASDGKASKKIGRQLSVQSNGNHYADLQRQESGRVSNGRGIASPNSEQKESFFSHLRKRARRLSGKPQGPVTPAADDVEASAARSPRQSKRNSMIIDSNMNNMDTIIEKSFENVDKALQAAHEPTPTLAQTSEVPSSHKQMHDSQHYGRHPERHSSLSKSASTTALDSAAANNPGPGYSQRSRHLHRSGQPDRGYDIPDEEDELLHEAMSANTAAHRMDRKSHNDLVKTSKKTSGLPPIHTQPIPANDQTAYNPYPTPSSSAKRNGMLFDQAMMAEPVTLNLSKARPKEDMKARWPTPPYDENEWGASAAASIFAAGSAYQ